MTRYNNTRLPMMLVLIMSIILLAVPIVFADDGGGGGDGGGGDGGPGGDGGSGAGGPGGDGGSGAGGAGDASGTGAGDPAGTGTPAGDPAGTGTPAGTGDPAGTGGGDGGPATLPTDNPPVFTSLGPFVVFEGQTLTFTVTATDPEGLPVTITAAGLPTGASFAGNVFTWTPSYTQAGIYTITFTASDGTLSTTQTITITVVDANAAPTLSGLNSAYTINEGQNLAFTVTATDPDGTTPAVTVVGMPTGASFTGNTFSWTPSYTQAGVYTLTVVASDGSLSTSQVVTITVIDVNLAPVFSGFNSAYTINEGSPLSFAVTATDPEGMPVTLTVSGIPTGASFTGNTFSWTPSYTQAGVYVVTATATDGTLSSTTTVTITVIDVNLAPVFSGFNSAYTINEGQNLAFTVTATDPDGTAPTVSASGLPTGAGFVGNAFSWTPDYTQAGVYTVTFTATDGTLATAQVVTITVLNVDTPPVFSGFNAAYTINEGSLLTFTVTATDPEGMPVTITAAGLPTGASFAGNVFTWTPSYTQAGIYTITLTASDGTLSTSQTVSITVLNVDTAPVFSGFNSAYTINEAQPLVFPINAADPEGMPVTLTVSGIPTGASFTGNTFSWTPSYTQAGVYVVTATATDGTLSSTTTITITVINVDTPPVFTLNQNQFVDENQLLTFNVPAIDPEGMPVIITAAGLPAGATFNGATFSWTPDFTQAGSYAVTFTATDGTLTSTLAVSITVNNVNRAPSLSLTDKIIEAGKRLMFQVIGVDPDNDPLFYKVFNLPKGASFLGNQFDWIPTPKQEGVHKVTFSVDDGNLSATQTIKITVTNPKLSLNLRTVNFPNGEQVQAGEELLTSINLVNEGEIDIDDVRIRGFFMDEGIEVLSESFDIDSGAIASKLLNFEIPSNLKPGFYYIGFSVRSDETRRVVYREIEVT